MAVGDSNEDIEIRVSEGQSVKATDAVSKGLTGIEKDAIKAQGAVEALEGSVKRLEVITRQTSQTSINRTVQAAERRAALVGTTPIQQAQLRTQFELSRVAGDQTAINRITAAGALEYQKLTEAANAAARAQLAAADRSILLANARAASAKAAEGTNAFAQAEEKVAKDRLAREQELRSFIDKSHKASIAETEQRALSAARAAQAQNAEIEALRQRAAVAGLSKVDQLVVQRNNLTAALGGNVTKIKEVEAAFAKLIAIEQAQEALSSAQGHGLFSRSTPTGRFFLGAKDLFEGRTTYAQAEFATAAQMFFQRQKSAASKAALGAASAGVTGAEGLGAGVVEGAAGAGVATGAFTGLASAAGLATIAVGGTVAVLGAAALVGYESAKSLAEWGQVQRDLQERTGLTTRELAQFQFAAKAEGQEVSVVERLMRGLASATQDFSPAGQKARDTLREMGISLVNVHGETKPTGQLLLEISDAFRKMEPGTKLAGNALDIFKRIGVETIPFLKNLRENTEYFDAHGLPAATQEEIDRTATYQRGIAEISTKWEALKRSFQEEIVAKVVFVGSVGGAVVSLLDAVTHASALLQHAKNAGTFTSTVTTGVLAPLGAAAEAVDNQAAAAGELARAYDTVNQKAGAFNEIQREINAQGGNAAVTAAQSRLTGFLNSSASVRQAEDRLASLKVKYDETYAAAKTLQGVTALPKDIDAATAAARTALNLYERQKETVRKLQDAESVRNGFRKVSEDAYTQSLIHLSEVQGAISRTTADGHVREISSVEKVTAKYREQLAEKLKLAGAGGLRQTDLVTFQRAKSTDVLAAVLEDNQKEKEAAYKLAQEIKANNDKILDERFKKATEFSVKTRELEIERINSVFAYEQTVAQRSRDQQLRGLEAVNAQTLAEKVAVEQAKGGIEAEFIARSAALTDQSIEREADKRTEAAFGVYQQGAITAQQYYDQVGVIQADATEKHRELAISSEDQIQASRVQSSINASRLIIDEDRKIFDTFKSESNGIIDQLFTKGQNVFQALANTAKTALLTVVKDVFSNRIAAGLTSAVTGQSVELKSQAPVGNTRLARAAAAIGLGAVPVFGLPASVTGPASANPTVAIQQMKIEKSGHIGDLQLVGNGAMPVVVLNAAEIGSSTAQAVNISVGSSGVPSSVHSGIVSALGALGLGIGSGVGIGEAVRSGAVSSKIDFGQGFGNESSPTIFSSLSGLVGGPGGTGGFAGPTGIGGAGGVGGGPFGTGGINLPGLGTITAGGKSGLFGGLGGAAGSLGILGTALGLQGAFKLGQKGGPLGIAGGAAVGALGGLVGAGTAAALFPSVFVPLLAAGPIGWIAAASIGAAVGLSGLLFKPFEKQVQERVKQIYGVDISKQYATSIANIIKQKYGGNIQVGLASPEIRDMINLYGAATNQGFTLNSATPRAGILAETGGKLYQQATTQYGQSFTLPSSLPTLGPTNGNYPLPSNYGSNAPPSIQLHIDGQGAGDFLAGKVVDPQFVASRYNQGLQDSHNRTSNAADLQQPGLVTS